MNNSSYFNPEFETMSREQIEALQLERLQKTVRHCMNNEFYQKKFKEAGITPDDIKTLADVRKLPFTTKQDLRETYPLPVVQQVTPPLFCTQRKTLTSGLIKWHATCGW